MKRVPMREDAPQASGKHPHADKPLAAFRRVVAVCNDCGHGAVLDAAALAGLSDVPSFGALWQHAFCGPCREAGGTGPANMMLYGDLAGELDTPVSSGSRRR